MRNPCGGGHRALCLRGPDPLGSLGRDTRYKLRWPHPAPDKELQLRAGERGGRRESGWPSQRRGADKGSCLPPRRPAPPPPQVPPAPWPRPGTLGRTVSPPASRHVRPPGRSRGTLGLPAPGSRERRVDTAPWASRASRCSRGDDCSLDPSPQSPGSLPEATSAHSPRGRPGVQHALQAIAASSLAGAGPEPGGMDAGGGARAPAGLGPSGWPLFQRALPSWSPGRGRACTPLQLRAPDGLREALGPQAPSGAARGPAAAEGALLAGAQAVASERGRAGRGRGAGRPD